MTRETSPPMALSAVVERLALPTDQVNTLLNTETGRHRRSRGISAIQGPPVSERPSGRVVSVQRETAFEETANERSEDNGVPFVR